MCIALTISFHVLEYVSDTALDLAEEDGQMDYTMNVSRGKKTTSTPKETVTDVDLTRSPEHQPAPGGPGGSSPAPSLPEGLPTLTKLKDKEQGCNIGKTSVPVASDKSTNSNKGKDGAASGDQEGLQVAFMHSELTRIREHVEKIAVVPQEIALLRNSLESTQGDLGVVGTLGLWPRLTKFGRVRPKSSGSLRPLNGRRCQHQGRRKAGPRQNQSSGRATLHGVKALSSGLKAISLAHARPGDQGVWDRQKRWVGRRARPEGGATQPSGTAHFRSGRRPRGRGEAEARAGTSHGD